MRSEAEIRKEIEKIKEHIIEEGNKPMCYKNIAGYEKANFPNDFGDRLMIVNLKWVLEGQDEPRYTLKEALHKIEKMKEQTVKSIKKHAVCVIKHKPTEEEILIDKIVRAVIEDRKKVEKILK